MYSGFISISSKVFQLTEELDSPCNSADACFSQSFRDGEDGVFDFDINFSGSKKIGELSNCYSLQPRAFVKLSVDDCAIEKTFVLSPERVRLSAIVSMLSTSLRI